MERYLAKIEDERAQNRAWYRDNRPWESQEVRDRINAWRREHGENRVGEKNKRRAAIAGGGGSHTVDEWLAVCRLYGDICLACQERKPLTRDHVIPVSLGGSSNIDNIQPLCQSCNSRKGKKIIDYRGMRCV